MSWKGLSKSINEVRVHFAGNDAAAAGLKSFISTQLPILKSQNPTLPIHVRESFSAVPTIVARYSITINHVDCANLSLDMGIEKSVDVTGMDESAVAKALTSLMS